MINKSTHLKNQHQATIMLNFTKLEKEYIIIPSKYFWIPGSKAFLLM